MNIVIDPAKAQSLIDEYLSEINRGTRLGCLGRTWMEFALQRHGLIEDVRRLKFMESHTLWYACLIITGNVRRVSRAEKINTVGARKTEWTIRQLRTGRMQQTLAAQILRQILENNRPEQRNQMAWTGGGK